MSYNFPEKEKEILKFWQENKIFDKLREKNKGGNPSTRKARSGQALLTTLRASHQRKYLNLNFRRIL